MMQVLLLALVFISNVNIMLAQLTRPLLLNDYTSIGICSKHFTDALSVNINPALLAAAKRGVGLYSERRYGLKELGAHQLSLAASGKIGGVGVQLNYVGHTFFNHTGVGIGYGKKLSEAISIGIQMNYQLMQIPGYEKNGSVLATIGTLWQLTPSLFLGMELLNPFGANVNKNTNEKWASVYKAGVGYEVSEQVFLQCQFNKQQNDRVQLVAGFQYQFAQQFFVRSVLNSASETITAGAGWQWQGWQLQVVAARHPQLGITPGLVLLLGRQHNTPDKSSEL
jgi:hypothetical protein